MTLNDLMNLTETTAFDADAALIDEIKAHDWCEEHTDDHFVVSFDNCQVNLHPSLGGGMVIVD